MANEQEKELAGRAAAKLVRSGDIVGLGTGSTAYFAVVALGERVASGLKITGIPTSDSTATLARKLGIPLSTLDEHPRIDITIDGADEIDPQLRLIKGGGGAMLREKIIATASKKMVVIADSSKTVPALGKFPLPVEIIPFARVVIEEKLSRLGATPKLRLNSDGTPFVTDEKHHILDCSFGRITDPGALNAALNDLPGVVEHGLFIGIASLALIAKDGQVEQRVAKPASAKLRPASKPKKRTKVRRAKLASARRKQRSRTRRTRRR